MKILLVDDEDSFRQMLATALTDRYHHHVIQAGNAMEGLKYLQTDTVELVLTDIKMPVMSGIEFIKKLRQDYADLSVMFITGHGDINLSIEALKLGAEDFILKPFKIKALADSLEKVSDKINGKKLVHNAINYLIQDQTQMEIPSQMNLAYRIIAYFEARIEPLIKCYKMHDFNLVLCLTECITNAIMHGNFGLSSQVKEDNWDEYNRLKKERELLPEYANKKVLIRYLLMSDRFVFEIEDEGNGFNTSKLPDLTDPTILLASSGKGLYLVRSMTDSLRWNEKGNCVIFEKKLPVTAFQKS
ncbi:MAG: response regulator [SAR324 cluster bacterium]|nr:response regulator [SAR324 cluster bacterium]